MTTKKTFPLFDAPATRREILASGARAGGVAAALTMPFISALPAHARGMKNISYGLNTLDIYPAAGGQTAAPILMYVHGGAWRMGSKRKVGSIASYFTKRGYLVASVGYTLYPSANAEQQALQVAQAVDWMAVNGGNFGGDGSRIALMGHSAGCHLSALASLSGATRRVRALVCNDTGAYDLAFLSQINSGRIPGLYSALDRSDKWTKWSPISYVGNRRQPPTLVMWSGGRNRAAISKHFADRLQAAGNPVIRFDGSRYNHISINSSIGRSANDPATRAVDDFLGRYL